MVATKFISVIVLANRMGGGASPLAKYWAILPPSITFRPCFIAHVWPSSGNFKVPIDVKYETGPLGNGVFLRYTGKINASMIISAIETVATSGKLPVLDYWLADRTDADTGEISASDVQCILEASKQVFKIRPGLFVVMVNPGPLAYGMSRMFQTLADAEDVEIHVVKSLSEAQQILGSRK